MKTTPALRAAALFAAAPFSGPRAGVLKSHAPIGGALPGQGAVQGVHLRRSACAIKTLLIQAAVALTCGAAAAQSQTVTLSNLRFVSDRGALTVSSPNQPLPGGQRGTLLAEFDFQTDILIDQTYRITDMDAFWKLEFAEGYAIAVNGVDLAAGDHWYGTRTPVRVTITDLDPATGACSASLALPVGGNAPDLSRFPLLPGSEAVTLTVAMGWPGQIALAQGEPSGALCTASSTFPAEWPEVWLGLERPQGHPQVGDGEVEFLLSLREPATAPRTFEITAQPAGRVTVLDPVVTFAAGDGHKSGRIRGEDLGAFRLLASESGSVVAESAIEEVVQRVVLIGWPESTAHYQSDAAAQAAAEAWALIAFDPTPLKKCDPAEGVVMGPGATYTICGGCPSGGACKGDGESDPGYIAKEGKCVWGFDFCSYKVGSVMVSPFKYDSSEDRVCKTITSGGTAGTSVGLKGGGGAGVEAEGSFGYSVTTYLYSQCCKYVSQGGPVPKSILDCE